MVFGFLRVPVTNPNSFYIVDDLGMWPVTKEYKDTGIKEGWLELDGWYFLNKEFAFYYRMV